MRTGTMFLTTLATIIVVSLVLVPTSVEAQDCWTCDVYTIDCTTENGFKDTCEESHTPDNDSCKVSGGWCSTAWVPEVSSEHAKFALESDWRSDGFAFVTMRRPLSPSVRMNVTYENWGATRLAIGYCSAALRADGATPQATSTIAIVN